MMLKHSTNLNVVFNILGKVWITLISIIFVPFYVNALGVEAYGLIGTYAFMSVLLCFFDFGLSVTLNRELAKSSIEEGLLGSQKNFIKTVELVNWSICAAISVLLILGSVFASKYWFHSEHLTQAELQTDLAWISIALSTQLPFNLYLEGLCGLQKQILSNTISCSMSTLRAFGVLLLLTYVSATLESFFIWQTFINLASIYLFRKALYSFIPKSISKFKFDTSIIKKCGQFASGMAVTVMFWVILIQVDKVLLSKLLPLNQFGFYSMATTVANGLILIVASIYAAFFPTFSKIIASKDTSQLIMNYHKGCQLMSILTIPLACLLILFAPEIMFTWSGNQEIVENTSLLVRLLSIGCLFCGFIYLPHGLQLASGRIKLVLIQTIVSAVVLIPLLYYSVQNFGVVGGPIAWILVNLGFVVIEIPIMHRTFLPTEKKKWYIQDIGLPLFGALIFSGIMKVVFPETDNRLVMLILLGLIFVVSTFVTGLLTPYGRQFALRYLFRENYRGIVLP